jgi:hypothetical protein
MLTPHAPAGGEQTAGRLANDSPDLAGTNLVHILQDQSS